MQYSIAKNSHRGTRDTNQDRVGYSENENGVFMVIADGLGGHAGGELAAQITVDSLLHSFDQLGDSLIADPPAFIVLSIMYAHSLVNKTARAQGFAQDSPRSTCVACLVQNGFAYWGHVGDSRFYLFNDEELLTRTVDHTTLDHLHQDGAIDEQLQRLGNSQLFRCIGGLTKPVVSIGPETHLSRGDTILLCTDGIWRAFDEEQLATELRLQDVEDTVDGLIAYARRYFHKDCDNLSALLFRWDDERSPYQALLNMTIPEMGQDSLLPAARRKASTADVSAADVMNDGEIDLVIEEIESLVSELDTTHVKPGETKKE